MSRFSLQQSRFAWLFIVAGLLCPLQDSAAQKPKKAKRKPLHLSDTSIYVMQAEGKGLKRLVRAEKFQWQGSPTFSPTAKQIAWDAKKPGGGGSTIFVANADGSNIRKVTGGHGCSRLDNGHHADHRGPARPSCQFPACRPGRGEPHATFQGERLQKKATDSVSFPKSRSPDRRGLQAAGHERSPEGGLEVV